MKQLVFLSGKGGTGKTVVAAAFAHLAAEGAPRLRAVLADADVDAANLDLVLGPRPLEAHDFVSGAVATIDAQLCRGCGVCYAVCRFAAVLPPADGRTAYAVDPIACEGCAACVYQCPEAAIQMTPQLAGRWFRSDSRYGPLFHASLRPAQENSGKLVTLVKQQARLLALDDGCDVVLVDGPPGIGCPAISAISGADLALIVAEPTAAGIHDMARVLEMTAHFRVTALVCINKADIYPEAAAQIEAYCRAEGVALVGRIPFDTAVTEALVHGQPVTAYRPAAPAALALAEVWRRVADRLVEDAAKGERS
ncbi:MAG: Septum site-determining protein MinD [Chloroflexi bacterium ADurb.Bin325]|nr:MAG: Septum site-determining protein MinD [Chloroflexi bacterium ADurb.Bin325]